MGTPGVVPGAAQPSFPVYTVRIHPVAGSVRGCGKRLPRLPEGPRPRGRLPRFGCRCRLPPPGLSPPGCPGPSRPVRGAGGPLPAPTPRFPPAAMRQRAAQKAGQDEGGLASFPARPPDPAAGGVHKEGRTDNTGCRGLPSGPPGWAAYGGAMRAFPARRQTAAAWEHGGPCRPLPREAASFHRGEGGLEGRHAPAV